MAETKNIYEKLQLVQADLKVPKNQWNDYGKYHYRNCEDIMEALKPVLKKHKATVLMSDTVGTVGEGERVRFYVTATARFVDLESSAYIEVSAMARESEVKKGMDESQITGATSSYARKYALNGLFLIDDNKDMDTVETPEEQKTYGKNGDKTPEDARQNQKMMDSVDKDLLPTKDGKVTKAQIDKLKAQMERVKCSEEKLCAMFKKDNIMELSQAQVINAIDGLSKKKDGEMA